MNIATNRFAHGLCALSVAIAATSYALPPAATLTGDWNGERSALLARGVEIDANYVGEIASHHFDETNYTDQWSFGANVDLQKLLQQDNGHVQVTITKRDGHELGAEQDYRNLQLVQEVYGRGQTWRLTQLWYQRNFNGAALDWKIGRVTLGEDFASFSCDFQNLTFCGAQPGNVRGEQWYNWPVSQWGTRLRWNVPVGYVQAGVYQVNPRYIDDGWADSAGLYPNDPSGTTGALLPLEFAWRPALGDLPGTYKFGVWYDTSDADDAYLDENHEPLVATNAEPLQRHSRSGAYIAFEQQISGAANGNGAYLFLNATQSDRDTAPSLDRQIAAGVRCQGIGSRTDDSAGLAFGVNHVNDRIARGQRLQNSLMGMQLPVQHDEYVAEIFYGWTPYPFLTLRPNVQYLHHPGGIATSGDLWLTGLKTSATF